MPVYIGMLMLLGIVAKNSILLIDFALEEMDKGVHKDEAIIDAGHKRAQPIVMTTVAMCAGMLPTALALSGDAAWRAPMGIVVIGGLILSTVLTLVLVPGTFSLALGIEERLGPRLRRWLTTGGEGAPRRAAGGGAGRRSFGPAARSTAGSNYRRRRLLSRHERPRPAGLSPVRPASAARAACG